MKKKIIGGCIIIGIIMTLYPPQKLVFFQASYKQSQFRVSETKLMEYRFIGDRSFNQRPTSIAYDRLLLQYAILVGAGLAIYLLTGKEDNSSNDGNRFVHPRHR